MSENGGLLGMKVVGSPWWLGSLMLLDIHLSCWEAVGNVRLAQVKEK